MGKEDMFGIDIFDWNDWDEVDGDLLEFYDVNFYLDTMQQYNGCAVSFLHKLKEELL